MRIHTKLLRRVGCLDYAVDRRLPLLPCGVQTTIILIISKARIKDALCPEGSHALVQFLCHRVEKYVAGVSQAEYRIFGVGKMGCREVCIVQLFPECLRISRPLSLSTGSSNEEYHLFFRKSLSVDICKGSALDTNLSSFEFMCKRLCDFGSISSLRCIRHKHFLSNFLSQRSLKFVKKLFMIHSMLSQGVQPVLGELTQLLLLSQSSFLVLPLQQGETVLMIQKLLQIQPHFRRIDHKSLSFWVSNFCPRIKAV
mmetsp:Transcript_10371/g.18926  ORF Transcript_10371/g.18926 Transcript_10371/m.18926 type:complete len:255 (-) Transcript_10371:501-1265(-)